jgi:hypothetical protein
MDDLLEFEIAALLEALRRDLRVNIELSKKDPIWAIWHLRNVQLNKRILEALNPKKKHPNKVCNDFDGFSTVPESLTEC